MTKIVRWNPLREMATMQSAMDRLFDESWREFRPSMIGNDLALDVHENEDAFVVKTDIPGVNPDDINVSVHEGVLTIGYESERENKEEDSEGRVLLQERTYGKFSRSIRLPQAVDVEKVEANYTDGVLTLSLPKTEESRPRQISIKSGKKLLKNGK